MKERELDDTDRRLDHLNRIFAAIRNVNRLIARARDSQSLLQGACDSLTETRGYFNVWIALLDSSRKVLEIYQSGLGEDFIALIERLQSGGLTRCAVKALGEANVFPTLDPPSECADCPLAGSYGERGAMTARIGYNGRTYGLLSVSVPRTYVEDKAELDLLAEVAEDLGHALFSMNTARSLRLHRHITRVLPNPVAVVDAEYRYQTVNEAYTMLYGVSTDEIVGRRVASFYPAEFFEKVIRPNLDRCMGGEYVRYETYVEYAQAGPRWMEMRYSPYKDSNGAVSGIVSMGADITEKKQNERHLKERVKELQAFHHLSGLVEASRDLGEIMTGASDILASAMRVPESVCIRIGYDNEVYPSHRRCGSDCDARPHDCICETIAFKGLPIGELRVCYVGRPSVLENNQFSESERQLVNGFAERLGHICGRYRAEEALRISEARYRRLSENSPAVVYQFRMAPDGAFSCPYITENVYEILGVSAEAVICDASSLLNMIHSDQRQAFHTAVLESAHHLSPFKQEIQMIRNGGAIWLEARSTPERESGGGVLWDGVFMDITYRKQAEKEMTLTLKAVSEGVWKWNFKTNELEFSPVYYTMLGYEPDEFPASFENWKGMIHPDDVKSAIRTAEIFLKTEHDVYENLFRMRTRSGGYRWIRARGRVVERDDAGAAVRMIGNHIDITDRRRAEKKLKAVERRNQALLDHSPLCHKIVDLEFNLQYMSANGFNLLKLSHNADVYGKPYPFAFFPERFRNQMTENLMKVRETGGTITLEAAACDIEGNEVWLESTILAVLNDDGKIDYITVVSADVTGRKLHEKERERLEGQLRQAMKMEAVGRLAGGVAHDFNNMMSLVIGYADMALEELKPDQALYPELTEIKKAGERSADLTRQLLAFARKQTVAPKILDLNETVEGMLAMLKRLIGENIELGWSPGKNLWPVKMDPGQIDQILANLCVNARDAIADVGEITIETSNNTFDETYCADHHEFLPGDYVLISVSDTGCGMDAENLDRVFEPFFTTKGVGKGTGLGLATIYGAVRQNNGFINVYSEPGLGTTFRIYIPRFRSRADLTPEKKADQPAEGGRETVLLVEDEPSILKLTSMMLEKLGYHVISADTPEEAIRCAREYAGEIQLLMTDVVMPGMNGRDLAGKIISFYPDLECLFMSGYTADVIAHHGVLDEGVSFIQKPFSRAQLGARVREALSLNRMEGDRTGNAVE